MTTLEYWEEREKRHAEETKASEDVLAKRIRDRMDALMVEMEKQIHGFYSRYAKKEGITMAEAQKRVKEMDVKAFENKAKKYVKTRDFSDQANKELRLYNATMRVNRLELLKAEMGMEMVDAFNDVEDMMNKGLTQRTLEEFERQAGILGVHNKDMTGRIDSIVNGSLNNATWSQRIWMYQGMLKNTVSDLLSIGIIQGRDPRELARDLVKSFGVTKANAERLMRTEMCRVQIEAQMESFKENGYTKFVFISTEDKRTCEVCNDLNGKTFNVDDEKTGENAPPMHPNCRCSTAAYISREELERELFGEENSIKNELQTENSGVYEGAPKSWKEIEEGTKSNLEIINPNYKPFVSPYASKEELDYNRNCVNCIVAYDLRQRGYDVVARPVSECNLISKADQAWLNPRIEVSASNAFATLSERMNEWGQGARAFVGIDGKNTGHAVVAIIENNRLKILDPQRNREYTEVEKVKKIIGEKITFWRIDNLDVSQTGYNACKGR